MKAWCYYESRLLGAHHALLSTYALETLVLYIFNAFHKGLCTPLQVDLLPQSPQVAQTSPKVTWLVAQQVLQKFLDVFSAFDWDSYCACLDGRIPMSSLPNPVTERLYGMEDDFLLDEDFTQEMLRVGAEPFCAFLQGLGQQLDRLRNVVVRPKGIPVHCRVYSR